MKTIVSHKTKKHNDWTDIVINANGKKLHISVNKSGYALVHSHNSDMDIYITGGFIYKTRVEELNTDGSPALLKFVQTHESLDEYHNNQINNP